MRGKAKFVTSKRNRFEMIQEILGKKYIRQALHNPLDFIDAAEKGMNAKVILNFSNYYALTRDFTADLLHVSEPTIYRWMNNDSTLDQNTAIQLLELTSLFQHGVEVFQSDELFFKWLELPNVALGRRTPREILEKPQGVSKINDLLGRIEHGVYS